ncbi:MAG: cobalamin biosynthesis protein CbiG [Methanoregula sp. PtaU1.Bin006]|uniref:cobalt-precorrin 5A hydrolase n=1 Tax=Methanoregula sp. PtaU1.Bin006 TaxID=1811681 RepID=UPI0009C7BB10|nr:cobalt-precorrin 5A hydrolase [Methanoregula sp. PtaU1.Bin006]OPY35215.1 MAG: cobalamin biosynthesis protein CbiG [Methanoregula sp. PtaU1.Bin006]
MTDTVVIALPYFLADAGKVASFLGAEVAEFTPEIFPEAFRSRKRIVALMSMGIVVRKIAPLIRDKWTDPAVVVISPDFRYAVPVLGGHHGANDLVKELTGLGLIPVITTATESRGRDSVESVADRTGTDVINRDSTRSVNAALLERDLPIHSIGGPSMVIAGPDVSILVRRGTYSIGIGCRKGTGEEEIKQAVRSALSENGISISDVFVYATTDKKLHETGLVAAVRALSGNLIFLDDETINAQTGTGPSRASKIGLPGVAAPCALATSRYKELIMEKKVYGRVTVAIAR